MSVREIREILERNALHLHRDRGQNFLVDPAQAERLVDLAGVEPGDSVIEVGTGLAVLTRALAARARHVHTIEIDAGLVRAISHEGLLPERVELVHADALELDWPALVAAQSAPVRVVANLPYSVATPLLRRLLDLGESLEGWSVMVQREIAERLTASPGSRNYGSLTVLHQLRVSAKRVLDLHPQCFFPAPRVTSSFLRVTPLASPLVDPEELRGVEHWVRGLFQHRRKTLLQGLRLAGSTRAAQVLERSGANPGARAETLPPAELLAIARIAIQDQASSSSPGA